VTGRKELRLTGQDGGDFGPFLNLALFLLIIGAKGFIAPPVFLWQSAEKFNDNPIAHAEFVSASE
jgi:hypothetical protein